MLNLKWIVHKVCGDLIPGVLDAEQHSGIVVPAALGLRNIHPEFDRQGPEPGEGRSTPTAPPPYPPLQGFLQQQLQRER